MQQIRFKFYLFCLGLEEEKGLRLIKPGVGSIENSTKTVVFKQTLQCRVNIIVNIDFFVYLNVFSVLMHYSIIIVKLMQLQ